MVEILICRNPGIGFPMDTLSLDDIITLTKLTLAIQATYYFAVASIKISILLMYLRFGTYPRRRGTMSTPRPFLNKSQLWTKGSDKLSWEQSYCMSCSC